MSRFKTWLRGTSAAHPAESVRGASPTSSLPPVESETARLADAMVGAAMIMNDDVDGAEVRLNQDDSSFHHVGRGVAKFLGAVLGFEQDVMRQAYDTLTEAENLAYTDQKKAQKTPAFQSEIYPAGSEYAVCLAYAQLMVAVVGVLNESVTESLRGFYKLRKAYMTLEALVAIEEEYLKKKGRWSTGTGPGSLTPVSLEVKSTTDLPTPESELDESDFEDAIEQQSTDLPPVSYQGHVRAAEDGVAKHAQIAQDTPLSPNTPRSMELDPDDDIFKHDIDIFVHSGINLCFGLMLLLLSMVPPVFSRILSIIGFRGDRQRGLKMLWTASKYANINGGVAGLAILGYHNGISGFCDILPIDETCDFDPRGYPTARCQLLLQNMRSYFPESTLWRLEEGRVRAQNKDLAGAIAIMESNQDSKMRQAAALNMFEKALNTLFAHRYQDCADSYIACTKLNNWSHALYVYLAGICYVELYRDEAVRDPTKAQAYKELAKEHLERAPTLAGRKRMMAKPLPFDRFVLRKVQKWQERAAAWNVDLVDAIGVSPTEEMIYLWNGTKRMSPADLALSLEKLAWDRVPAAARHQRDPDEAAIFGLIKATVLRCQRRFKDARGVLEGEVLIHDRSKLRGGLKDDYTAPCAHYEMAVIAWTEKDDPAVAPAAAHALVAEAEQALDKVARWEGFVLDARIGMKVATGQETVRKWKLAHAA